MNIAEVAIGLEQVEFPLWAWWCCKRWIRVGGSGGGKMARKVMGDANFFPVDLDAILNDNNIDAALASLKGIMEESRTRN